MIGIQVVDVDLSLAKLAGELKADYDIGYANAFAAALAKIKKGTVVTCDKGFKILSNEINILLV
jgi:predicted nucleic acid-binding protein